MEVRKVWGREREHAQPGDQRTLGSGTRKAGDGWLEWKVMIFPTSKPDLGQPCSESQLREESPQSLFQPLKAIVHFKEEIVPPHAPPSGFTVWLMLQKARKLMPSGSTAA